MANGSFLLAILIIGIYQSYALPNIMNITEVVLYARNIVDTIKDISPVSDELIKEPDHQLVSKINYTRAAITRMIERKMKREGGRESNIRGIKFMLNRNNLTVFILNDTILNLLPPEQKVQINVNKILMRTKSLINDLPQLEIETYHLLHTMLQQLKNKLHLETEAYDRATGDLFMVSMNSEFLFTRFNYLVRRSESLSVSQDMFRRLSSGILEMRSYDLINRLYPMFTVLVPSKVPGFYKALYKYLSDNNNKFKFEDTCDIDIMYQNLIKQIYEMAFLIDYRILIMTIAARKYMEIEQPGDYNGELLIETQDFISRAEHYLEAMKNLMQKAPRDIKRCDLEEDMIDKNSFHLSNLSTGMISLIPQVADYENNMVVTNARLQKKNNVVHIQIQQGRLRPGGTIDLSTLKWIPVDDIVQIENVTGLFKKFQGDKQVPLVYDQDFTYLHQGDAKFNIDDINLPVNYVVTGVSFSKLEANDINQWNSNAIGLKVLATPYDYYNGILNPSDRKPSEWISANDLLELNDNGTYSKIEVARVNKFVEFHMRNVSNNTQEVTVPFFDSRPAGTESFTSLSGFGIIKRETVNNDSFLIPKMIAVDHSEYVITSMHPSEIEFHTRSQDYFDHHEDKDINNDYDLD